MSTGGTGCKGLELIRGYRQKGVYCGWTYSVGSGMRWWNAGARVEVIAEVKERIRI